MALVVRGHGNEGRGPCSGEAATSVPWPSATTSNHQEPRSDQGPELSRQAGFPLHARVIKIGRRRAAVVIETSAEGLTSATRHADHPLDGLALLSSVLVLDFVDDSDGRAVLEGPTTKFSLASASASAASRSRWSSSSCAAASRACADWDARPLGCKM